MRYRLTERWYGLQGESRSTSVFANAEEAVKRANARGDALEADGWVGVPTFQTSYWTFHRDGETADLRIEQEES